MSQPKYGRSRGLRKRRAIAGLLVCWLGAAVAAPGFVFQVTRDDRPPSYLIGTMHVDHPEVTQILPIVRPALQDCRLLMLELLPDGPALMAVMQAGMLPPGQRLSELLDPGLYREVKRLAGQRGMPEAVLQRFRPWSVATTLSLPPDSSGNFLDLRLYQMAQELGVGVAGLEKVEEQLGVFDALSNAQQILLLRHAVKESDGLPKKYAGLVDSYAAGDLERLAALGDLESARLPPALVEWYDTRLLSDRNARMLARLLPELETGGVMVAVGALHLPGRSGLIASLEAAGYRVRRWP